MARTGTKNILLVEDEAIIAFAEASMLKRHGYEVRLAHSAREALDSVLAANCPDLVLMDIDLGSGMSGAQAADIISRQTKVPVLFLSGHTESEIVEQTEGVGGLGYVVKNSGDTVLLASIRMAFRLQDARLQIQSQFEELERINGELARSEAEFRGLFEAGPVAVGMLVDRRFVKVNRVMCELFGYSEAELVGNKTRMLYEEEGEYKRIGKALSEQDGPAYRDEETRLKRKDGTVLDVHICLRSLDPRSPHPERRLATTVLDITRWKEFEQSLREAEARLARNPGIGG